MIILTTGGTAQTLASMGITPSAARESAQAALTLYAAVGNILVQGGANGWDEICRSIWHHTFQLPYVTHPAAWDRQGKAAGPVRNIAMVRGLSLAPYGALVPDVVIVGPGDRGTNHCRSEAEKAGIKVVYATY